MKTTTTFLWLLLLLSSLLALPMTATAQPTHTITNAADAGAGSLRQAVLDAADGDIIVFQPGLSKITLSSQIEINKAVTIRGPGASQLTISGGNTTRIFFLSVSGISLSGLTIADGNADRGGGILINLYSPTISNCVFIQNTATNGGAMSTYGAGGHANPVVTNCLFQNNSASYGGAMYNSGSSSSDNGGATTKAEGHCSPLVTNCSFINNSAYQGGAIVNTAWGAFFDLGVADVSPVFTNCSFQGNVASDNGGVMDQQVIVHGTSSTAMFNCVVFGNLGKGSKAYTFNSTNTLTTYGARFQAKNCFFEDGLLRKEVDYDQGYYPDPSNIVSLVSPFINITSNQLNPCTLAINAGNSIYYGAPSNTDLAGNPRIFGNSAIDMGAYEFQGTSTPSLPPLTITTQPAAASLVCPGSSVTVSISVRGTGPYSYQWYKDDQRLANQASATLTLSNLQPANAGRYYAVVLGDCNPAKSTNFDLSLYAVPTRVYVKAGATGNNTGVDWNNAFPDLQSALNYPCPQNLTEIWVAQGTYKPSTTDRNASFLVSSNLTIYGGFPNTGNPTLANRNPASFTTILSGDINNDNTLTGNSYHVLRTGNSSITRFDGVVITGGNADGTAPNDRGAGIYVDHSTASFANCTFQNNSTNGRGAGVCIDHSPTSFSTCIFQNNTANDRGAGIYNDHASPSFNNCIFQNNTATYGAALFNDGLGGIITPSITACLFQNNTATNQGGAIYNYGSNGGDASPYLVNCGFLNNSATSGGGALFNNGTGGRANPVLTNCSFQTNLAPLGGGMFNDGQSGESKPALINCLLFNNGGDNTLYNATATVTATYSLFDTQTGYTGSNNLTTSSSPFASQNGLQLSAGSMAIDRGNSNAPGLSNPLTGLSPDLAALPRLVGCRVDIGAYEYQSSTTQLVTFTTQLPSRLVSCTGGTLTAGVSVTGTGPFTYQWFKDGTSLGAAQTNATLTINSVQASDAGVYFVVVTGTCNSVTSTAGLLTVADNTTRLYVKASATGANTGLNWDDSFTDLQSALNFACLQRVTEIWVAQGLYKPTPGSDRNASFSMRNGIIIYGGFVGNEQQVSQRPGVNPMAGPGGASQPNAAQPSSTTLSGDIGIPGDNTDNAYHVINNPQSLSLNATAVLNGVVITGGNANGNIGFIPNSGGGVFNDNASPTLVNCVFVDNAAISNGGAVYNLGQNGEASPQLTNCLFVSNGAVQGGAIANNGGVVSPGSSNPVLTNCVFVRNVATNQGGALYNYGQKGNVNGRLINCRFDMNTAQYGGAIYNAGLSSEANLSLINCSFVGNSATGNDVQGGQGGAMANVSQAGAASPVLTNCSFQGNSVSGQAGFGSQGSALYNAGLGGPALPRLTNCVVFGNGGTNTFINQAQASVSASYSLFETSITNYSGTDNKLTSPSPFASMTDTQLTSNSPAINAGTNAALGLSGITTDLAGNPRIRFGTVDMGAYEFPFNFNQTLTTNNGLNFDGQNDYVAINNTSGSPLTIQDAITIEYWFKGTNSQSAVRLQPGTDNANYIVTAWNNSAHILSNDGGTGGGLSVGTGFTDGNWHHIAFTWQRNTANGFRSYLDGQLVAQRQSSDNPLPVISSGMGLGAYINNATEYTSGSLDEVRIWSVARSQAQLQASICGGPLSLPQTGLVANYGFNYGEAGGNNADINTVTNLVDANTYRGLLNNFAFTGAGSNWVSGMTGSSLLSIVTQPAASSMVCGGSASVSIGVTGSVIGYQWFKNGSALGGQTAATLAFANVQTSDVGTYWVVVTGTCNSLTSTSFSLSGGNSSPSRLYVKAGATGAGTGLNWADAFPDLQPALSYACSGNLTEIWVAQGTYKPAATSTDRTASFSVTTGISLYGGFPNTGNSTLVERNPASFSTILSGDIDNDNTLTGNSYHVLRTSGSAVARIDGVVIKGGNANGAFPDERGGGLYNDHNSPLILNCSFLGNTATYGAAVFNGGNGVGSSSPSLTNCLFQGNSATNQGGAIYNYGTDGGVASPRLINCAFVANTATAGGGALYNNGTAGTSSPILINCSFQANGSPLGGVMFSYGTNGGSVTSSLTNCVLFNNGSGNVLYTDEATVTASYSLFDLSSYISDPTNLTTTTSPFASTTSTQLKGGAPAINAGNNQAYQTSAGPPTDLIGNARIQQMTIDMGAYEGGSTLTSDLTLILFAQPTTIYGKTAINVVVNVYELNSIATQGSFSVKLSEDALLNLNFDPNATTIAGRSVQNRFWSFSGPVDGMYTVTSSQPIGAGGVLSFGLSGNITPGVTKGKLTITATVIGTGLEEYPLTNNSDAETIEYFNK